MVDWIILFVVCEICGAVRNHVNPKQTFFDWVLVALMILSAFLVVATLVGNVMEWIK